MANTLGENIKQLFRRFSDGALVAKNDSYDVVDGHQHIQYAPSHVWAIDHAKGSTSFSVNVFINDELAKCDVEIVDDCNVMLIFSEEVAGYANLLFLIDPNAVNNCAPAPSLTPTPTITPSITVTPSLTPTMTPSVTSSVTPTISLTPSQTRSLSATPSVTASLSLTPSPTVSPTMTLTPTITISPSGTSGVSPTPTVTPSVTGSVTPTVTATISITPTMTVTGTPVATVTPTATLTLTPNVSISPTPTVTATTTVAPTVSTTPTVTYTPTPTSSFTPTPTITLTQHDCKFDGSSLTGWVNVGAEMKPDPTDSSKQVIGVPIHSYAYINCNQPFDISTQINVDVYMPTSSSVIDLLLGCNSTGAGIMVRFDSRNYPSNTNNPLYYCGFIQSSSWTTWAGDPTNGYAYAYPTAGWHSVNVRVNLLSDAGIVLDLYVDGVFVSRSVPLNQYGNYIGFNGDQNGSSYGYLRNFQITRDFFITPSPTPTQSITPSVTPTLTKTISITPTHSTTPTPTPSTGWAAFAHRYWRMNITSNNGNSTYLAVAELAFYNDDASAVSLVNSSLSATNYLESSEANTSNKGQYAFDNDRSTKWTSGSTVGYIGWDFGTPQMVKTVGVIGNYLSGDQPTLAPKDFTIQYSDNGSTWTTAATITNQTAWGAAEKRIYTLDAFSVTPTPTPTITLTPSVTLSST